MHIVHEGRGGYIEMDDRRYSIEHVEGGRFCIHFRVGKRHENHDQHLATLEQLVREQPDKWALELATKDVR